MKTIVSGVVVGVCLVAAAACSSGSGGGGGGGGSSSSSGGSSSAVASCQVASQNVCYVFLNGAPETAGGDGVECQSALGGKVVSSCPTSGLLGCCLYSSPSDYECFYQGSGAKGCSGGTGVGNWSSTTLPGSPGWTSSGSSSSSGGTSSSSSGVAGDGGPCGTDPAEVASPCTAPLLGACVYAGNTGDSNVCTETAGDASQAQAASGACTNSPTSPGQWFAGMTCAAALGSTPIAGGCVTNAVSPSTYCQTQYWGMGSASPACFSCSGVCALEGNAPCVHP